MFGKVRKGFKFDGRKHVRLNSFAANDVALVTKAESNAVDERKNTDFGANEIVKFDFFEPRGHLVGNFINQFNVAKKGKTGERGMPADFDEGKLSSEVAKFEGVIFHVNLVIIAIFEIEGQMS